jgi:hypothetical protein
VLSAHQGGGEPMRPMPLEITQCLCVPGAELAPPPPRVRCGPGRVMAVDTPWPNGQACHNCGRRYLMPASGCWRRRRGCLHEHYLCMSSCPSLGASACLARLATLAATHRGRRLPLLPVTLPGLLLFPSEM